MTGTAAPVAGRGRTSARSSGNAASTSNIGLAHLVGRRARGAAGGRRQRPAAPLAADDPHRGPPSSLPRTTAPAAGRSSADAESAFERPRRPRRDAPGRARRRRRAARPPPPRRRRRAAASRRPPGRRRRRSSAGRRRRAAPPCPRRARPPPSGSRRAPACTSCAARRWNSPGFQRPPWTKHQRSKCSAARPSASAASARARPSASSRPRSGEREQRPGERQRHLAHVPGPSAAQHLPGLLDLEPVAHGTPERGVHARVDAGRRAVVGVADEAAEPAQARGPARGRP